MTNASRNSILVVDDDNAHRTMLRTLLKGWGHSVDETDDGSTAIDMVRQGPYDLILMDIRMIRVSGLEALVEIKAINPAIPVIIMTAYSSVESAVQALKNGAYDYLTKPLDFDELKIVISRAMDHTRLREENRLLKQDLGRLDRNDLIGRSPAMVTLLETVVQVAPSEATILITGESGSGKEVIAGAIHSNSARSQGPFIKLNCAAITETLLESELFGHEKGSFTGAYRKKEGRFAQAHGGSLFLDEVSEMSFAMQAKLLRVIQEKEFTRVGGEEVIKVDVRLIAATNRDLMKEIEAKRFREDLYYRLNVVSLKVPPLRDRKEDIPLLTQYFLKGFSDKNQKTIKGFTPSAMDCLIRYNWPGNVRELMNAVERGVVLTRTDYIDEMDIPFCKEDEPGPLQKEISSNIPLEEVERSTILNTLESVEGNKSEAARRLGITRRTLHKKLKNYGVMPL
jgi:two-component system response regulator HydG